jgi:hypothetical protein
MKYASIIAFFGFLFISLNTQAQTKTAVLKTETIKVWGNCGMCKSTIEKAARNAGAAFALWNENSKELKVKYAAKKTSNNAIQQKIANAGYDTQDLTASDEAYKNLHECCQYERKATKDGKEKTVAKNEGKDCCSKDNGQCSH